MKCHIMSPYPPEQTSIDKNLDKKNKQIFI